MGFTHHRPGLRYRALLQLLRTSETLWNASRVFFARWEMSSSQFNVLNLLYDQPEGCIQTELSRQLIMHRSNITGLVDRLEKRGLVQRQEAAADRRAYRVVLTAAGRRLLEKILPEYHRMAEEVWGSFPASRAKALAGDLERLAVNAENLLGTMEKP